MITSDLQLPITKEKISGPIVDAHNNRKESDNYPELTSDELLYNYYRIRAHNFKSLKLLSNCRCETFN